VSRPKPTSVNPEGFYGRLDFNRHFALEWYRDDKIVRYLAYTPKGLDDFSMPVAEFFTKYKTKLLTPLVYSAQQLLKASHGDYLPGPGVLDILTEILTMASTQGTGNLTSLDMKGLVAHYNNLGKALGRQPIKEFKSKAEGLKRIAALEGEAKTPTPKQQETAEKAKAEAAKAIEKAKTKEKPAADPGAKALAAVASTVAKKGAAPKAAKKAEKAKKFPTAAAKKAPKADGEAKPRGQGIGAFCQELILKGKSNEEVLEAVKKKFPTASTSASSVAWYRNKLKSEGKV
jgi:hypothetical protein